MKTSLKKLRGFALGHGDHKDRRGNNLRSFAPIDELAQASQDMEDMRDCYDSLLSAAAATVNSAFEFSESLRELGACLLQKTALNDDEETGKVLLMLGKVQFELQKLVDNYRSHINQTITVPSDSLLNELRNVEEMKRQCDEKRDVCEYMKMRQREKGRGRSGKVETFSLQQLQAAHEEYDVGATLFVFRLKSLKQGQSRSLLTQAARHHAAQLCFFTKALKSLEAIEPHVKLVTEQQHIDYHFSGLEDDGDDGEYDSEDDEDNDDDDSYDALDDGELSFDYGQNDHEQDVSTSRNSMEVDLVDVIFPQVAALEASKRNRSGRHEKSFSFRGDVRTGTQSAPLFAEAKSDTAERMRQKQPSFSRRLNLYALPTPVDSKRPNYTASGSLVTKTSKTGLSGGTQNLWYSTPIELKKYGNLTGDDKFSGSMFKNAESVLRESNRNTASTQLPPPPTDGLFASQFDPPDTSDFKKIKRYAFSGPITSRAWPAKPLSADPTGLLFSGPLLENSAVRLRSSSPKASPKVSPKISPAASPTFVSTPKISELHELPRPPSSSASKSSRPLSLIGHSAPLVPKGHMHPVTTRSSASNESSPLPLPSQAVTRSFSIPSNRFRAMAMNISKPLEAAKSSEMSGDMASSPPLTPILLSNT